MIRNILNVKDVTLRKKSRPVSRIDKKVKDLVKDLKETLEVQNDPEGVGLAAPQIGKNLQVFVMKLDRGLKVVINPKIKSVAKIKKGQKDSKILEGCLSLPNYYGPLKRSLTITIEYLNEEGKKVNETFQGLDAQIVQHEIDHLEGVMFIDRLLEQKRPLYEYIDGEWEEVELV